MPSPKSGESEKQFISRCMSDEEAKKDFPKTDQRYAFCKSKFDKKNKVR